MAILPTFPKFLYDRIMGMGEGIANAVTGGDRGDPAATSTGGAARRAVEYMLRTDQSLSPEQRSQLMQWLRGEPLLDLSLVEKVNSATMGQPVEGAGPMGQGPVAPGAPAMGAGAVAGARATSPLGAGATAGTFAAQKAAEAPPAVPSAAPSAPTGGVPPGVPSTGTGGGASGMTEAGGAALLENPEYMMRFIQRGAGLDPERGGMASKFFANFTGPTVAALQGLYDFLPGQGEGMDYNQIGENFANFGKQFITPGQSGLRSARDFAHQIATNPEFTSMLGGMDDGTQMQRLEQLMALKNAGARGLREAWLNKQYENLVSRYQDSELGLLPGSTYGGYGGNFTKMLQENPELARRLFGWAGN